MLKALFSFCCLCGCGGDAQSISLINCIYLFAHLLADLVLQILIPSLSVPINEPTRRTIITTTAAAAATPLIWFHCQILIGAGKLGSRSKNHGTTRNSSNRNKQKEECLFHPKFRNETSVKQNLAQPNTPQRR